MGMKETSLRDIRTIPSHTRWLKSIDSGQSVHVGLGDFYILLDVLVPSICLIDDVVRFCGLSVKIHTLEQKRKAV